MFLSGMLSDYLRELESEEERTEIDKFESELAASLEGFTSVSEAFITSVLQKYRKGTLEDSLDSYYVRKGLRDAPKFAQRTLQLTALGTKETPSTNVAFYIREATRCYIHGFWAAGVALSRAALEQGLKEAVSRALGARAARYELSDLLAAASKLRLADPAVLGLAVQVRLTGNRVVHARASSQGEAWDTLTAVRAVLTALYRGEVPAVP